MNYADLNRTESYRRLKEYYENNQEALNLAGLLSESRIAGCRIPSGGGLSYNYAAKQIDSNVLQLLASLAEECGCTEKYKALASGEIMNTGEKRKVLHHLMRGELAGSRQRRRPRPWGFLPGTAEENRFFQPGCSQRKNYRFHW